MKKGCAECGHPTGHEKDCKILLSIFKAKSATRSRAVFGRA
jgi:hypothetical protein